MKKNFWKAIKTFSNWILFVLVAGISVMMDQRIVADKDMSIMLVVIVALLAEFIGSYVRNGIDRYIQELEEDELEKDVEIKD